MACQLNHIFSDYFWRDLCRKNQDNILLKDSTVQFMWNAVVLVMLGIHWCPSNFVHRKKMCTKRFIFLEWLFFKVTDSLFICKDLLLREIVSKKQPKVNNSNNNDEKNICLKPDQTVMRSAGTDDLYQVLALRKPVVCLKLQPKLSLLLLRTHGTSFCHHVHLSICILVMENC